MSAPALEARGLAAGHGRRPLVEGIELAAEAGTLTALIGPNGSGKTTVLRTLAGQLAPLAGTIELMGRPLPELPGTERARLLACLFTRHPRCEMLSAQEVVDAGRYPLTGRLGILGAEDERRVRETMEEAGVWELRDRDFAHMSDGQRQRVLIARALVQEPRVLLLDEPTSYLDIHAQIEVLALLRRWARSRGVAVIASLHDIGLALRAADRIACVKDGRLSPPEAPEDALRPERVGALFGLPSGAYDPDFGTVELERAPGAAEVFVVAGGGSGAATFRALQRAGVPFAAGVLARGDVDCALACALAERVIACDAFEPVGAAELAAAREALASCRALICCCPGFGTLNARNAELVAFARERGIPCYPDAPSYLARRA